MNNCLGNLIGVKGCGTEPPIIELNVLPGISTKSLESLANEDQISYLGVIENINTRVATRIEADFVSSIGMQLKRYNEVFCTGRLSDPLTLMPVSVNPGLQGIIFQFLQSKQLVMTVLNIYFRSPVAQTLTFYIKDLFTGDDLFTVTKDLVQGENVISIDKEVFPRRHSNRIFIGYEGSLTEHYDSTPDECYDDCTCDCNMIKVCGGCSNITGWDGSYTNTTYGLSVEWAATCSYCKLLLDNITLFKSAVLYAAGIEYLYEVMGSSRLNMYTTTALEEREKLLCVFQKQYDKALKAATSSLNLCDSCCFECVGGVKYKYVNTI